MKKKKKENISIFKENLFPRPFTAHDEQLSGNLSKGEPISIQSTNATKKKRIVNLLKTSL